MNDIINSMVDKAKYVETIRCMSEVLTDIANALGIPESKHGDPDEILDAIEELKADNERLKKIILDDWDEEGAAEGLLKAVADKMGIKSAGESA